MSNKEIDWLAAQQPQRIGTDPGARERALVALVQHTNASGPGRRHLNFGGVFRRRAFGFGVALGAAAIAAALVLSAGGNGPGASLNPGGSRVQAAVPHHAASGSPLVHLADYVSPTAAPAGDATLVARTTQTGDASVTVYDLYADDGQYFFSQNEDGLQAQVDGHHSQAGGQFAREVAAAKLAATGSVQAAAQQMADAPDPSHVISRSQPVDTAAIAAKLDAIGDTQAAKAIKSDPNSAGSLFDNWVWEDSQDALIAGSGQPQVRAGVLQILATLPGVTVAQGTSDGQPTLILTAGAPEMGYGYSEQLTINASTGVPIQFVGGSAGSAPAATVTYKVSRVTLASLPSAA